MKTFKVSWLMPVYNAEKYLCRAMDSILAQTLENFEVIIIIEHGCKDKTQFICEEYAKRDSRIRLIINKERLGIAKSLNIGIDISHGEYIARMDADDFSYPTRLEKQVSFMDTHKDVGILCTNRRVIMKDGKFYYSDHPTNSEEISARLLFGFCLNHPSMMLRGDLFRQKSWRYPIDREAEDFGLCAHLVSKTRIACLKDVLLDYYEHGENAIFSKFPAVRKASADISRQAINERLGVETSFYDDIYFGWREKDYPQFSLDKYLVDGFNLFKMIYEANDKRNVIGREIFKEEIKRQWKLTTDIIGITSFIQSNDFLELMRIGLTEEDVREALHKFSEVFSCHAKVLIWGTGNHCKETLSALKYEMPFDILYFVDSDESKVNQYFFGKRIISPSSISEAEYDYIAIATPQFSKEIYKVLVQELKVNPQKIFSLPPVETLNLLAEKHGGVSQKNKNHAFIFMAPDYGNLGDHAIIESERYLFKKMDMIVHEIPADDLYKYIHVVHNTLGKDVPIFITGGGFFGALWNEHQKKVEQIMDLFPDNPIFFFPQTFYWPKSDSNYYSSASKFRSRKLLIFCARDFISYMKMKSFAPNSKVLLVPDMVLFNEWGKYFQQCERKNRAILCLKNDKESILSAADKAEIEKLIAPFVDIYEYINTDKDTAIAEHERRAYLTDILTAFRTSRLIVTDRLHGMIFAAITETPCVALNNCNHKLRSTYEWLHELPYIFFANKISEIESGIQKVFSIDNPKYQFEREVFFSNVISYIQKLYKKTLEG